MYTVFVAFSAELICTLLICTNCYLRILNDFSQAMEIFVVQASAKHGTAPLTELARKNRRNADHTDVSPEH